jgi:glycosyltransferase involved in cell wall biosynthesis
MGDDSIHLVRSTKVRRCFASLCMTPRVTVARRWVGHRAQRSRDRQRQREVALKQGAHCALHIAQPVEDGVAMVVADLTRRQARNGWDVIVASPPTGWLRADVIRAGATHVPWSATREPGPETLLEAQNLARTVRAVEPDIVHLHSSKAGLAGRLAIRGRVPTVFSPHAWSFFHVAGATGRAALAWERFATRWADVVLCGSEAEKNAGIDAKIAANFRVIPNSSQISDRGIDQREARSVLGLDENAPVVICFGRYAYQKGQDVLLEAWPAVTEAVPDAILVLVGSGPEERHLRELAASDVQFSAAGDRENVVRWILAADVLAFPSRWETMSLAVLEALELGRAVVVSDCQGMSEALAGGAGAMVPRENPQMLAQELIRFAADRELARLTGEEAARRYERVHGAAQAERFASYTELLRTLIAARQK